MFRTRKQKTLRASVQPIVVEDIVDVTEENEEGSTVTRVVLKPKSLAIKDNLDMVTREEYSLENLLAAGVGLEQLNVSNLLSITDKADAEAIGNSIAGRGLKKFERKQVEEEFAALVEKNNEVKEEVK